MQRFGSEHYVLNTSSTNIWNVESNLRKARRKSGYGIHELSKFAGIPRSRLYAIENKQTGITLSEIALLAQFLEADAEYIRDGLLVTHHNRCLLKNKKSPACSGGGKVKSQQYRS
ncbi:helix-turn-helix domain-containing protein [Anaerospora hongkongensis]|uniref:helix-turn-helix domain-containing protein n=1 Tax=Anaerospora hongkongensis TaxID=244830 RepID=UPI00289FF26C|nr:helix-turn-helix transcriptional regulator [Anaerospora hongkongensis]